MFVVLFAAIVLHALTADEKSFAGWFFTSSVMRFFGKYSYGLYVFHHFISYYFVHHRTEHWLATKVHSHLLAVFLQSAVGLGVSIAISMLSFHLFEKRFLSLKRHWEAAHQKPAPAPAPIEAAKEPAEKPAVVSAVASSRTR
jgi:peptidoglycan/LPS O-acetylase OafA/YrhL